MFTDFGKKPLLENWLPWKQRNVYLQFLNLKILLMPSYEKSPSFKVIACSVLEFWAIYWAGVGKHPPPPGANRVNLSSSHRALKIIQFIRMQFIDFSDCCWNKSFDNNCRHVIEWQWHTPWAAAKFCYPGQDYWWNCKPEYHQGGLST